MNFWCVECRGGPLRETKQSLACPSCGSTYPVDDGIPDLMPRPTAEHAVARKRVSLVIDDLQAWRAARDADANVRVRKAEATRSLLGRALADAGVHGDVLDVGGCDGWVRSMLNDGDRVVVVDPAPRPAASTSAVVCRGIGERLPFDTATFDWILMLASFDYFTEPLVALSEAARVLRPGGRLLLTVPVYPAPVATFLDPYGGLSRLRAASDYRLWRILGPKRVFSEIRAGFRGRPRFHFHYYTESEVIDHVRTSFDVSSTECEPAQISRILVTVAQKRHRVAPVGFAT